MSFEKYTMSILRIRRDYFSKLMGYYFKHRHHETIYTDFIYYPLSFIL